MAYDKFLIAPYKSGLKKDVTTWLEPKDSFKQLENVHIYKGKVVKRFGEKLVGGSHNTSRARVKVDTTDGAGAAAGTVPGAIFKAGQVFSIGIETFTVRVAGAPANLLSTGLTSTGTFNTTSGAYTFTGAPVATDVYWYPSEPIMGITQYELGSINEHTTYVFDTQFIYKYDGSSFIRDTTFTGAFTGSNRDFFWACNYVGVDASQIALFVSNFNSSDKMYYYDSANWIDFTSVTKFNTDQDIVLSAKIIIQWRGRLLLLGLIEQDISGPTNENHLNRVRYSHYGDALHGSAWLEEKMSYGVYKGNGGGYIDLPIEEEIMSAIIIKDRLIVYCERSTWELSYTGNPGLPFVWRSINTKIGCEARFATIDFINEAVTIATTGIYACNGSDVARIDESIPDEVFSFLKSATGTSRIHGILDMYNNLAYWTILDFEDASTHEFPTKILVFNYKEHTWSFYDDTITTFGHLEDSANNNWSQPGSWDTFDSWGSYYQQGDSRFTLAGNHQGFLFIINGEHPENAPAMTVADVLIASGRAILTIPDHNIADGEFVLFIDDNITYGCDGVFKIERVDADNIYLVDRNFAGVYKGGGEITRVSKITIQSNDWNPYVDQGDNVYLSQIDFCIKNTQDCEMTVDYDMDTLGWSFVQEGKNTFSNMGTNVLELHAYSGNLIEHYKKTLWRTVYFQAAGEFVNITISMSDAQMLDSDISLSPFELQGMIIYTMKGLS